MLLAKGSVETDPQTIPGQRDSWRQFRLIPVVVVVVGQVGEVGVVSPDASRCGERLVQAHVGGVGLGPQRIENPFGPIL